MIFHASVVCVLGAVMAALNFDYSTNSTTIHIKETTWAVAFYLFMVIGRPLTSTDQCPIYLAAPGNKSDLPHTGNRLGRR
jgi:hypothetical protein